MPTKKRRALLLGAVLGVLPITLIAPSAAAAPEEPVQIITSPDIQPGDVQVSITSPDIQPGDVQVSITRANGSSAPDRPSALPPDHPFRVLQMNLCNSGVADCYEDGQAIPEGAAVIEAQGPAVVTLNEICTSDVDEDSLLLGAMANRWPAGDVILSIFVPVYNRAEPPGPVTCDEGRGEFGNALIAQVSEEDWAGGHGVVGRYPDDLQNPDKNRRAFVCFQANGVYNACATHLDAYNEDVAMEQCHHLLDWVLPVWIYWESIEPDLPTVVGGDLNLTHGFFSDPDVQECVPDGWFRKGDDSVQHIMATDDFTFNFSLKTDMEHTDHPAWLVALRTP